MCSAMGGRGWEAGIAGQRGWLGLPVGSGDRKTHPWSEVTFGQKMRQHEKMEEMLSVDKIQRREGEEWCVLELTKPRGSLGSKRGEQPATVPQAGGPSNGSTLLIGAGVGSLRCGSLQGGVLLRPLPGWQRATFLLFSHMVDRA